MNECSMMPGAELYVAVDNVCAWPNLTRLPNGEIAAAIYDKPSHGLGETASLLFGGGRGWQNH